jgi:putative Ca2+/H+ antiporter (TMEM165/GDT1 family)
MEDIRKKERQYTVWSLLVSTIVVALAEMGDKTQLLSFVLAARFKLKGAICVGILVATLANHFLAGSAGVFLSTLIAPEVLRWGIALAFLAFGAWALKTDTFEQKREVGKGGVFLTTAITFFLVEMGDKTQLATVALAARYHTLITVVLGTTLGMMIANVPAVWLGETLARRVNMRLLRWLAAALFFLLAILTIVAGGKGTGNV